MRDDDTMRDFLAWGHYCSTATEPGKQAGLFTRGLSRPDRFNKTWREKLRNVDREWADRQLGPRMTAADIETLRAAAERAWRRSQHLDKDPQPIGGRR